MRFLREVWSELSADEREQIGNALAALLGFSAAIIIGWWLLT